SSANLALSGRAGRRRPLVAHRRPPVPEVGRSEAVAPTSVRAIRGARISFVGACRPMIGAPHRLIVGAPRATLRAAMDFPVRGHGRRRTARPLGLTPLVDDAEV